MRNFIVTSAEKLVVKELPELNWKRTCDLPLQLEILNSESLSDNIRNNEGLYVAYYENSVFCGFPAEIGKQKHPLVEQSYASMWYNSNIGGIYLIGFDEATGKLFAPVQKKATCEGCFSL